MSTAAKPDRIKIAAALHEMLDGFREAGVLPDADVDRAIQPIPAPDNPDRRTIVPPADRY